MTTQHFSRANFIATGLMLFALFFGAGNLIFPALLGQQAGENLFSAIFGFLLTGVGLPLLGVIAIGYSASRDVQQLASRVTPWYGILFASLLYLSIGPLFATPRTATVAFEIGVTPFLSIPDDATQATDIKMIALSIFSIAFFAIAFWLSITPSKLVDRIGKILTPILLIFILILVGYAALQPMGDLQAAQAEYVTQPLTKGILEGYNTMDALASLVFAIIVIDAVRAMGVENPRQLLGLTIGAGMIASICLAVVYILIAYMGAISVSGLGMLDDGTQVLSKNAAYFFGPAGNILLAVIVFLACLSTAVGLITSCSEYFNRLIPKISYKAFAILFTIISCALANKGLAGIIKFSIPMLMLLYPLTVVIILLAFLHKFFGGGKWVYRCTIFATAIIGLMDAYNTAFTFSKETIDSINAVLPFYGIGLGWVLPAVIGFVIGLIVQKLSGDKTPAH